MVLDRLLFTPIRDLWRSLRRFLGIAQRDRKHWRPFSLGNIDEIMHLVGYTMLSFVTFQKLAYPLVHSDHAPGSSDLLFINTVLIDCNTNHTISQYFELEIIEAVQRPLGYQMGLKVLSTATCCVLLMYPVCILTQNARLQCLALCYFSIDIYGLA